MKVRKKIINIAENILVQMYKEATPPADFKFLSQIYKGTGLTRWTQDYVLRRERQMGIFFSLCDREKCNSAERVCIAGLIKNTVPRER